MFNIIKYAASQLLKDTFVNPINHISAARCFSTVFSSKNYAAQNGYSLKNLSSETLIKPLLSVEDPNISHTRNVTKFSLKTGNKKSVGAVLSRFYRLECGLWIRRRSGCHKRKHKKYLHERHAGEQHVFCTKTQSLMLDAMITDHWKKKKYFIDDPFEPYKVRNNFDWVQLKRRPQ